MRLSRKGWNNVVIFAMLIMIFFLNGMHHKLNPPEPEPTLQRLMPVHSFILTATFPEIEVERIGKSWRTTSSITFFEDKAAVMAERLIDYWLTMQLRTVASPKMSGFEAISAVTFWLAGEEQAKVFQLYQNSDTWILLDKSQQRWFTLGEKEARYLFQPMFEAEAAALLNNAN